MEKDHINNAIDFALENKVAEMTTEVEQALYYKIINALEQEKIEAAKNFMTKEDISDNGLMGRSIKPSKPVSQDTKPVVSTISDSGLIGRSIKSPKSVSTVKTNSSNTPPISDRGLF